MASRRDNRELRITNVPTRLREELENVVGNLGTTVSGFLKPKIRDILESYSPDMKLPPKKD
jgi:hypothetical protein